MTDAPAWRCATCEHWKAADPFDWQYDKIQFAVCKRIRQREDIETSAINAMADPEDRWSAAGELAIEQAFRASLAIAVDGSGYYAAVRTAPDFGCILWEEKTT